MATIRRLRLADWELLRAVRLRALLADPDAFASSHAEEVDRPETWWQDGMSRLAWFIAEEGDRAVGIAAGLPDPDNPETPELISMWVEEKYRGSDLGRRLLDAVITWARAEGAAALCLAVAEDNDRAVHFYERAGFRESGARGPLGSRCGVGTLGMRLSLPDGPARRSPA